MPEQPVDNAGLPGLIPRPDPSVLTTEQLRGAIAALREILEARLNGMDKAIAVHQQEVDKRVEGQANSGERLVQTLREVHDEKFKSVDRQMVDKDVSIATRFQERDTRSEREARDNKIAVDAAFAAAKEAVAEQNKSSALAISKSEAATTKQIDQLVVLIQTTNKASDDKIDDIKTRLDRGVGQQTQALENKADKQWTGSTIITGIAAFIAFNAFLVAAAGLLFVMLTRK